MKRINSLGILVSIIVAASTSTTFGQVASALVREGQDLPGGPAGQPVTSINNPATNHVGGFSVNIITSATLSRFWGNSAGGAGALMRTEGSFPPYTQTAFEAFYGLSDSGQIAYSPTINGGPVAGGDSVWRDDTPVAVEGLAHPTLAGQFWRFGSRPGITANGIPYFGGGITNTSGGATQAFGLFYGADGGTALYLGGQTPTNLPRALSTTATNFSFRFSANGSNWISPVTMIAPAASDATMLMNGSGLLVGGSLAQESMPIPAAAGGMAGENWANFDFCGINNAGDYFITGDSSLAANADEFILKNGQMLYRDGMTLDGETVQGDIEAAYMNENGDIAFIWDIQGGVLEALYLNDNLLLKEGDAVDLDNDGIVEANSILRDFTGIASLAISDQHAGMVDVYFTADIDVNGTPSTTDDVEGFFRITATLGVGPLPCCKGDIDGSAHVDRDDINEFIAQLVLEVGGDPCPLDAADVNNDTLIDGRDIAPFVERILANGGTGTVCPG